MALRELEHEQSYAEAHHHHAHADKPNSPHCPANGDKVGLAQPHAVFDRSGPANKAAAGDYQDGGRSVAPAGQQREHAQQQQIDEEVANLASKIEPAAPPHSMELRAVCGYAGVPE